MRRGRFKVSTWGLIISSGGHMLFALEDDGLPAEQPSLWVVCVLEVASCCCCSGERRASPSETAFSHGGAPRVPGLNWRFCVSSSRPPNWGEGFCRCFWCVARSLFWAGAAWMVPLAQQVRGQKRGFLNFLSCFSRGFWRGFVLIYV